ncbi:MAG: hypothetical protein IT434_07550 [Phycisphaerales bacterium]|jgi:hypothetical protein|nr:hypothetical protein [Phycisphaerales bacterium]
MATTRRKAPKKSIDELFRDGREIDKAVKRAVARAIAENGTRRAKRKRAKGR